MGDSRMFEGGCHCGAIRFRVRTTDLKALDCDCSICTKKGFIHLIVEKDAFELLSGREHLRSYRFNTGVAVHQFCKTCGIHPFYVPRSHPDGFDINVRCLDGDAFEQFEVSRFEGRNWEEHVDSIR